MAELVDALDLGSSGVTRESSSLSFRTIIYVSDSKGYRQMRVSVETKEGLERQLTVNVPQARIEGAVDERLRSLAKTAKFDGFRPGKVPMQLIQKRYGPQVRQEVLGEVIRSSFLEAVQQEKLALAGTPTFAPKTEDTGEDFQYTATFEVYPEIELQAFDQLEIEKPVAQVEPSDIDDMIERLRSQRAQWTDVERAAQEGDRVVYDAQTTVLPKDEDEQETVDKAEGLGVVIGSGAMPESFEQQLLDVKAGDEKAVEFSFPDDFSTPALAGHGARSELIIHSVQVAQMPEVDEAFVKSFGIAEGTVEQLRENIEKNMQQELDLAIKNNVKRQMMDALLEQHEIAVPRALIQDEIKRMQDQMAQQLGKKAEELALPNNLFEDEASRRVKLGLIVVKIAQVQNIKADPKLVRSMIERIAQSYQESQAVIDYYYNNQELLGGIEALAIEDSVIDWLTGQVRMTEKPQSFKALMEARDNREQ